MAGFDSRTGQKARIGGRNSSRSMAEFDSQIGQELDEKEKTLDNERKSQLSRWARVIPG